MTVLGIIFCALVTAFVLWCAVRLPAYLRYIRHVDQLMKERELTAKTEGSEV
jgi:hypothetical protein